LASASNELPRPEGDRAARPPDHDLGPPEPAPPPRRRSYVHLLLFLGTIVTTTVVGGCHYHAFEADFGARQIEPAGLLIPQGLWYSATILAILGAHEFGHYLTCRYYRVDVSLPYFIPAPIWPTGTLGAFIRIREPIRTKPMLFDIGVAGPIAGFVVAVPALVAGLSLSRLTRLPDDFSGLSLGEPLLFQIVSWLICGPTPEGYSVNLHPMGFAAWFGLLATALNLFPIAQLDGGHIAYAAFGRRSTLITLAMAAIAVLLTFWSRSWIVWTIMLIVMIVMFGPRHPRTVDEHIPLDRRRRLVALGALLMFILCFTPAPIEPLSLIDIP
jgi:membrane-associated protease RseP (regulator of RpoE activity)